MFQKLVLRVTFCAAASYILAEATRRHAYAASIADALAMSVFTTGVWTCSRV